ncbi:MAG: winged helix-turn-helix domain-containing protein [Nitrososphaerales archaeon]|nr:winged helix-turn-helix domain-containing protein [Nitrososphaerales archaeon]
MLSGYQADVAPGRPFEQSVSRRDGENRVSAKNRGRLDTVAEIVNSCNGGANKSRIMLLANINSVVATELLGKIVASGLVTARREDGASVMYYPTQEGLQFVRRYGDLVSMLCPGMMPPTKLGDAFKGARAWI